MRAKIFGLVAILFVITILGITLPLHLQVHKAIEAETGNIVQYVKRLDLRKRESILQYFNIAVIEKENQLKAIFHKINDFDWMKQRFLPSESNYKTNDWKSSSVLMMTNPWLDMVQTTARGKLTSAVVARPPYLNELLAVPVSKAITVVIAADSTGRKNAYIAVPYWTAYFSKNKEGQVEKQVVQSGIERGIRLLFSVPQLLEMDAKKLKLTVVQWYTSSLDPSVSVDTAKIYDALIAHTIESIEIVQEELKKNQALINALTSPTELEKWIESKVDKPLKEG